MPRFVIISDLHVHPWAAFARGEGLHNTRLQRTLAVLDASLRKAHELEAPWLFPGDLVHTAGYALNGVLAGVTRALAKYPDVKKALVWGNHDATNRGKITVDQTIFGPLLKAVPQLYLIEPGVVLEHGGVSIHGAGYQPRRELLDLGPDQYQGDIGIFHQTVRGSETAHGFALDEGIDPEDLLRRYRVSVVGHVHHPQELDTPLEQAIIIPGSPEHHNFGDRGPHGWWILNVPTVDSAYRGAEHDDECSMAPGGDGVECTCDRLPSIEFVPGGSPEFRTVETSADLPAASDGHYYRVRSMRDGDVVPPGTAVMSPSPTTVEARDILRGVGEPEQILQAWMQAQPPEDLDREVVLDIGRQLLAAQDPVRLRPVRLTHLTLHNFGSYADAQLRVQEGTWLVTGQGRDFPSNGSGKSTLVGEALYWLLFGKNTKGMGAGEVIRWGAAECAVSGIVFEENHADDCALGLGASECDCPGHWAMHITRTRGSDGHFLRVKQNGIEWEAASVNEMTDKLGKYFGLTPEIYQNLAYFSQEKLLLFSSATDGERKEVLADLVGLSAYQQAAAAAGVRIGDSEKKLAAWDATLAAHTELLVQEQAAWTRLQGALVHWDETHAAAVRRTQEELEDVQADPSLDGAREQLARIREKADALVTQFIARCGRERSIMTAEVAQRLGAGLASQVAQFKEWLAVMAQSSLIQEHGGIDQARVQVGTMQGARAASTSLDQRHVEADAAVQAAELYRTDRVAGLRHVEQELAKAVGDMDRVTAALGQGTCPTCRQPVLAEHRDRCLVEAQQVVVAVIARRDQAAREVEEAVAGVQEKRRVLDRAAELAKEAHARIERLTALSLQLNEIDHRTRLLDAVLAEQEQVAQSADREAVLTIQSRVALYQSRMKARVQRAATAVKRMEDLHRANVAALRKGLEQLRNTPNPHAAELASTEGRIASLQEKLKHGDIQAHELRLLVDVFSYWRHGFSKQGIQSLLVEEIAILFNAARADIFPLLTQGVYDVQFSTMSHTAAGEAREKTEFLIFEHGAAVPYGALSGGQRRRVDVGIMLVLVLAVARWMRVPGVLGLLVLDEVFGFLDASGAEGLQEALQQVRAVIPTIYVVTHDTHLQSLFPDVIRVEQDADGVSSLVS